MAETIREVAKSAAAIVKGMGVTLKELLSPTVTEDYPDAPPRFQERYRGVHVLQRDENGLEKCVACFLCAAACPANCIYIEAAENTDEVRISGGERYAKVYNIDYSRCIFCGYCEEACPTYAIQMTNDFEMSDYDRTKLVYEKDDLLISGQGKYTGYNYWRHAGVPIAGKAKGEAVDELPPVDVRELLP